MIPRTRNASQVVKEGAAAGDPAYLALGRARLCHWCGTVVDPAMAGHHDARTFDHVIPAAEGGPDTPDNLVPSCRLCNELRDRTNATVFRGVADRMVRPHRHDLDALALAFLAALGTREARVAWGFSGLDRAAIDLRIARHGTLGNFDLGSRKQFGRAINFLARGMRGLYGHLDTATLESLIAGIPDHDALRARADRDAAEQGARRQVIGAILMERAAASASASAAA